MAEAEFQTAVIDLAHVHGWLVAHFRAAKNRPGGVPLSQQTVSASPIWYSSTRSGVSYSANSNRTPDGSPPNNANGCNAPAAGADAYVWRPCDWPTIIATTLMQLIEVMQGVNKSPHASNARTRRPRHRPSPPYRRIPGLHQRTDTWTGTSTTNHAAAHLFDS